jgi:hypothetical protein
MKNSSLALFAAVILIGWTSMAAGVIATFAGQPAFSSRAHQHHEVVAPVEVDSPAPLYSNSAAPTVPQTLAAAVPHSR